MIMAEQWIRWEPISDSSGKYYVESISDNIKEFKILLAHCKDKKKRVRIIFDCFIYSYRSTDEGCRLNTIVNVDKQYGAKFYAEWTFFKVINSSYVLWLSEQSGGIAEPESLTHFSLFAMDSIVDVIAEYEPIVELIK